MSSFTHLAFFSLRVLQVEEVEEEGSIEQNLEPTDLDEEKEEEEKRLESPGFPGPPPNWVNTKNVGLQVGSRPQHLPQHHPITITGGSERLSRAKSIRASKFSVSASRGNHLRGGHCLVWFPNPLAVAVVFEARWDTF